MKGIIFEPPRSSNPEDLLRWAAETTEKLNRYNETEVNNGNEERREDIYTVFEN